MEYAQNQQVEQHLPLQQLAMAAVEQLQQQQQQHIPFELPHIFRDIGNEDVTIRQTLSVSSSFINRLVPYVTYNQFVNLCMEQNIATLDNSYKIYQYYIRYLACSGRINDLFHTLVDIQNNYLDEEEFNDFLNDTSFEEFNFEPFIFTFVKWNSHIRSFQRLVNMGCNLGIIENGGNADRAIEDTIHGESWISPFNGVMNIPGFPDRFTIGTIMEAYNIPMNNNTVFYRDNQNRLVVRNDIHFGTFINAIIEYAENQL